MYNQQTYKDEIRLAVVLSSLDGGGIERMRIHLIDEWMRQGFQVDLVVGRFTGSLCEQIPDNVQVYEIGEQCPLMFPLGLRRYIRERRPTHILSAGYDINLLTLITSRFSHPSASITISIHSQLSSELKLNKGFQWLKIHLVFLILRHVIRWSHAVIVVSHGIANDLKQYFSLRDEQLHVVYNPVITPETSLNLQVPLTNCPVPQGTPWILYVGRLVYQKNIDVLINAFKLLSEKSTAHLVLMGAGPLERDIARLIRVRGLQQRIHMVGFHSNPLPWMRHASVLALPSRYEGLPNVLIEAMASGTQIVAADCPSGPSEILDNGRFGQLVPVGDAAALADALLRSLDGRFHVNSEVLSARAALFSSRKAASEYISIITR